MPDLDRTLQTVDRLIARGAYRQAIDLLEREQEKGSSSLRLQQQLADLYVLTGARPKAVALMLPLVDRFAEAGLVAKAIAVLKRIEHIEPGQQEVEERLAQLIRRRQGNVDKDRVGRRLPSSGPTSTTAAEQSSAIETSPLRDPSMDEDEAAYAEEVAPIVDSPLFAGFSTRELVALIRGLGLSTHEAGEIVVSEGESGHSLFVLAGGSVRVYVRDDEGHNHQIRILRPPEFFGEICLFDRSARTATVVAATTCELLRLDGATLATIGTKHPDLPRALHRAYSERVDSAEERQGRGDPRPSP